MTFSSVHRFTSAGLLAFENAMRGELSAAAVDPVSPAIAEPVAGTTKFSVQKFETAKEMATAVLSSVGPANLQALLPDRGVWAWLTFVLRDELFKKDGEGRYAVGELHRWYPSEASDWRKGQRHLVRMPVLLLQQLGTDGDHLLCNGPSVLPEIREQLTSQQDMFTRPFQRLARALYFNDATGKLKAGAGGKSGGTPRRLARVRQQLDVTWELDDLAFERALAKLPKEFDRFKPKAVDATKSKLQVA